MARRPTPGSIQPRVGAAVWLVLALALPAAALDLPGKSSATLQWASASGPVAGYQVFVGRNGSRPSIPEQRVSGAAATVTASVGDTLVVWVQAYDAVGNVGPSSADSQPLRFLPATGTPPTPGLAPTSFSVTAAKGSNAPPASLAVRNLGTGTLSWRVSAGASWLTPAPTTGTTTTETDAITLAFATSGLAVGSYATTLTFTNTQTLATVQVPVTLSVALTTPSLAVDATQLTLTATSGQPSPAVGFTVRNAGIGTLAYTVSDSAPWLLVAPSGGSSTGESDLVSLTAHTVDLTPGSYTATLAVSAPGAVPSLKQIPVTLQLLPAARIETSVTRVSASTAAALSPRDQALLLRVNGGGERSYTLSSDVPWLVPTPAAGTSSGEDDTITLRFDSAALPPGEHLASLQIASPGIPTETVPVTLRVRPPSGDADGDGTSEAFLWSRSSGKLLAYSHFVDGQATGYLLPSGRPADWQLLVSGDYDGDGSVDLLWRHRVTGSVGICLTDAVAISLCGTPFVMPASRTLLGSADYDGDGRSDVAFRDPATGAVEACFMNGLSPAFCLPIASFPPSWRVTPTGDFDRDGRAELVAQDPMGSRLQVCAVAGPAIGTCQLPVALLGAEILATGDYDGDGRADILWRSGTTLLLEFWTSTGWASFRSLGKVAAGSEITGSSDVDGDGTSDLLLRDPATGVVEIWFVGATGLLERRSLGPLGLDFVLGGSSLAQ